MDAQERSLTGKRIAVLGGGTTAASGPRTEQVLTDAGATVEHVDPARDDVAVDDFDGVVALGAGLGDTAAAARSTDVLRGFLRAGKPVAVLGTAVRLLIAAGVVRDRTVTCTADTRATVLAAGGNCVDYGVVADHGLVSGATDDDVDMFLTRAISEFALAPEQPHDPRSPAPPSTTP